VVGMPANWLVRSAGSGGTSRVLGLDDPNNGPNPSCYGP
jgi:hypothetical protein